MIALALLGPLSSFASAQDDAWAQIWTELETLRGGKISAAEAGVLRGCLGDALRMAADGPRAQLLGAALEDFAGHDASSVAARLASLAPCPFTPRELWFLADLMPAGLERARKVLAAMQAPPPMSDWQVLLAWNAAVDESRALRFEETALPIQLLLHERYLTVWSAEDLALTYRFIGQWRAGDQVLDEAITRERAAGRQPAELWERRGIHALGFGDQVSARDYLGLALAGGLNEAGLLLSRLDLIAERREEARRGLQASLLERPPQDWAWRGWGMALLPAAAVAPAILTGTPPNE